MQFNSDLRFNYKRNWVEVYIIVQPLQKPQKVATDKGFYSICPI